MFIDALHAPVTTLQNGGDPSDQEFGHRFGSVKRRQWHQKARPRVVATGQAYRDPGARQGRSGPVDQSHGQHKTQIRKGIHFLFHAFLLELQARHALAFSEAKGPEKMPRPPSMLFSKTIGI